MARVFMSGGRNGISDWFGTGEDGDLIISTNTNLPVEADIGHILKQYNSLTINAGVTLKPENRCAGMVIAVREDCVINGAINMDLMAPRRSDDTEEIILNSGISSKWLQKISTLVGGRGGNGGGIDTRQGIGGNGHRFGGGLGGGGAGSTYYSPSSSSGGHKGGDSEPRPPSSLPWPYTGNEEGRAGEYGAGGGAFVANGYGSGGNAPGGGGAARFHYSSPGTNDNGRAGNAYGGGLLVLIVGGKLLINGTGKITSHGGDGGVGGVVISSPTVVGYSGGGGGGGIIAMLTRNIPNVLGGLAANGGRSGVNPNYPSFKGNDGSIGTIVLKKILDSGNLMDW